MFPTTVRDISKGKLSFSVYLCNHCNLNCYGCGRWCNLVKHPQFYAYDDIVRDVTKVVSKGNCRYVSLSGGEPLLHPRIIDLIYLLGELKAKYSDLKWTAIETNGKRMLKMPAEFYQALKDTDTFILFTRYPSSSKIDYNAIAAKLDSENIKYQNQLWQTIDDPRAVRFTFKHDGMNAYPIDGDLTDYQKINFTKYYKTCINVCVNLWQGKIFKCSKAGFIDILNDFCNTDIKLEHNISEDDPGDYITVDEYTDIQQFVKWVVKPSPLCRYCQIGETYDFGWYISKDDSVGKLISFIKK